MRKRIADLARKPLVQNIGVVAFGTALAQAVAMLFSPFITRLYGPEAFGVLGVFMSIITILTPIAALTYPIAIVLPKHDVEALFISRISFVLSLILSFITGFAVFLLKDVLSSFFKIEVISAYLWLIPVAMFFSANLQVVQQWLIRKQMFKSSSKVGVFHSFVTNGLKLGGGFILPTAAPLVFISAVAPGIQSFMLLTRLRVAIRMRFTAFFRFSFSSIKKVSKRYYDFPLYRAPQILINSISQSVPVFLLTAYFGPASVGFYSIGKMVLGLPSHLIGKSVSDVFYPRIAQAQRGNENISKLLFKATALMALVGLVPFGVIVAFGPWLFELVFGAEWTTAGEYARWMAIWLYFAFLNRPALSAIPVINMQKFFLAYEIASGIIRALALFVGFYWFKNDVFMVAAYSVAGVFLNLFLVVWVIIKSKQI